MPTPPSYHLRWSPDLAGCDLRWRWHQKWAEMPIPPTDTACYCIPLNHPSDGQLSGIRSKAAVAIAPIFPLPLPAQSPITWVTQWDANRGEGCCGQNGWKHTSPPPPVPPLMRDMMVLWRAEGVGGLKKSVPEGKNWDSGLNSGDCSS